MRSYPAISLLIAVCVTLGGGFLQAKSAQTLHVRYDGQTDLLTNGKLTHEKGPSGDNLTVPVTRTNPTGHSTVTYSGDFDDQPVIPHGNHMDVIVKGRLLHKHGRHYDDHGPITIIMPKTKKAESARTTQDRPAKTPAHKITRQKTASFAKADKRDQQVYMPYYVPAAYYPTGEICPAATGCRAYY